MTKRDLKQWCAEHKLYEEEKKQEEEKCGCKHNDDYKEDNEC